MVTPPKAVLFDADGVLQQTADWREELAEVVDPEDEQRQERLLEEIAKAEGPRTMTGEADLELVRDLVAPVRDAVGDRIEVLCDGGVRRGSAVAGLPERGGSAALSRRGGCAACGRTPGRKGRSVVLSVGER